MAARSSTINLAEASLPSVVAGSVRRSRVLVIDDDVDLRAILDIALQREGYDVHGRADGIGALAAALTLKPDVVILDWMLPTYSGLEVCSAIRSRRELDDTKVIMMSGRRRDVDVELGYAAGADRYVVKPVVPRVLMQYIRDLTPA